MSAKLLIFNELRWKMVLAKGTWGFAASDLMTEQEAERVGKEAVAMAFASSPFKERAVELAPEPVHSGTWKTPVTTDPFAVPTDDIVSKLLQTNEHALAIDGIKYVSSSIHFLKETKLFVNSEGAEIEQEHHRLRPNLDVTAFGDNGDFRRRSANLQAMGAGYEWVEEIDWLGRVDYAAEEANVCGRPTKCKQFFRQIWQCDQVLTCVRPLDAA